MSEFIKPTKRVARPKASSIDVNLNVMLQDIYRIIRKDIDHLASQPNLNEIQARILNGHAKLLLDVQKENRIADKEDREKNSNLSDDELKQLAKKLMKDEVWNCL